MIDQFVNFVVRPPRAEYDISTELIGPRFKLRDGKKYCRNDLELVNPRGYTLQCSHYVPQDFVEAELPCVIYCHGNSGCRADANDSVAMLLPSNITVFALDFSGSGCSGGEYVSLGYFEKDDVETAVNHLRAEGRTSLIGLWGRSMGAVTALLYGAKDPSIAGIVLDSPFANLNDLILELVDEFKVRLPKFGVKIVVQLMRRYIRQKANFDILDLDLVKVAASCFTPALMAHAEGDTFIRPHHSEQIHEAYSGDKNIIKFPGDHNSPRPQFFSDSVSIFFHNVLNPPEPSGTIAATSGFMDATSALPSWREGKTHVSEEFAPSFDDFGLDLGSEIDEIDQATMMSLLECMRLEGSGRGRVLEGKEEEEEGGGGQEEEEGEEEESSSIGRRRAASTRLEAAQLSRDHSSLGRGKLFQSNSLPVTTEDQQSTDSQIPEEIKGKILQSAKAPSDGSGSFSNVFSSQQQIRETLLNGSLQLHTSPFQDELSTGIKVPQSETDEEEMLNEAIALSLMEQNDGK